MKKTSGKLFRVAHCQSQEKESSACKAGQTKSSDLKGQIFITVSQRPAVKHKKESSACKAGQTVKDELHQIIIPHRIPNQVW